MNSVEVNTLPDGWDLKPLGEIVKLQNGFAFKKSLYKDSGSPIVRIKNIKNEKVTLDDVVRFNLTDYNKDLDQYKIVENDILIAMSGATTGKIGLYKSTDVAYLNQRVGLFRIKNDDLRRYLLYFLSTQVEDNLLKSLGAAQPNLSSSQINEMETPIPPLEEQKRLVSKIDTLFAKIDKAISLTEESLKQAKNLLPSVLKEVFENCEGETMTLNTVSEIQPKKNQVKNLDCEVSFVPMKFLNEKKIDFVPESDRNISEVYKGYTYFQDGDILLAKVIPCFQNGKSGVAKGLTNGIGFGSSEFIVFRPYDFILQEWLYYNISSSDFLFEGNNNMSGAVGLKRLTKSFVSEWKIKVPDLKTQKKFIDRINKVSNQSTKTQSKLERKLAYLKQLKSSILSKAFKGEL